MWTYIFTWRLFISKFVIHKFNHTIIDQVNTYGSLLNFSKSQVLQNDMQKLGDHSVKHQNLNNKYIYNLEFIVNK